MSGNKGKPARGPKSLAELLAASPMLSARTAQISLLDWQRSVGERLAVKTFPERISDGVLTVRVPSSTWAQELSLLSQVVLDRLQAAGHRIQRLRFHVAAAAPQPDLPVTRVRRVALPTGLQQSIARLGDPEMRDAISEAAAYSLGRKSS
jgi:hypothetical protein